MRALLLLCLTFACDGPVDPPVEPPAPSPDASVMPPGPPDGPALWLVEEGDRIELWAHRLGPVMGIATRVWLDETAAAATLSPLEDMVELLRIEAEEVVIGFARGGGAITIEAPTLLAEIRRSGTGAATLTRTMVRRRDGSFVAISKGDLP